MKYKIEITRTDETLENEYGIYGSISRYIFDPPIILKNGDMAKINTATGLVKISRKKESRP